ncbi:serine protease nudel isoform X1 [Spodoptera litura]|uniref:Serine protease nudel isoform X1 n=1 Tax=Spodoptera litura TaxID=69820 RepID=A0A9J7EB15_SPOLT|nr:serine protease nudel isoform X1 [Spodoptera litura]
MTSENMKERWDQLGLPPMELAESSGNSRDNNGGNRCLFPSLQKLLLLLLLTFFAVGTYILLLRISENTDSTKIIIVTGNNDLPNVTLRNIELYSIHKQEKNDTSEQELTSEPPIILRKKREITSDKPAVNTEEPIVYSDELLQKSRDLMMEYDVHCRQENRNLVCKDLVTKLRALQNDDETNSKEDQPKINLDVNNNVQRVAAEGKAKQSIDFNDLTKRDTLMNIEHFMDSVPMPMNARNADPLTSAHMVPHSHSVPPQHLSDTCLLARLIKQNYPRAKEIYEPSPDYIHTQHHEHPVMTKARFFSPSVHTPYFQERDMDTQRRKIHPQDVDIFMSMLAPKVAATPRESNQTKASREAMCPRGTVSCLSGDTCIDEKQWCDGNVDCLDVSDEASCACKERVDKSRLCDGYFDCPFGEDEMGCYGCSETMFSCEDLDISAQSTCFSKEQRCNNVVDCPNHKDELECNMLAPSLLKKPLFAISNTEGFLHRNFKGDWYAVCKNPYMWAHDACRRETGVIIRPPFISTVPIDPMVKIDYLNTGPGGLIQTSDTCMNSSAVYVTCPDLICGTRVQSTSQLLKQSNIMENRLFGRNKRYFPTSHAYPPMFYGNRYKRDVDQDSTKTNYGMEINRLSAFDTMRNKRTESRVVGGRPSQPAAWPWMVAVYRNGMFHCGGVVINHSWVISAAHCVSKFWKYYYEVQVGMLRRFSFSPQEQSHRVTHVIVNQFYSQTDMKNDMSLLRVEPAIQFSRWVRPICLPSPDTAGPDWLWGPAPGTICTAVGWGATTEKGPDPDHMREVEVPIWENCKHREDQTGKEICAGFVEGGKDACQGDSGGPLLCRNPLNSQQWYMAGIVSHGDGCGRKDEPGVYTRVSLFVKWIKYYISSNTLPTIQPIQECPGFKCDTGISKCLPNKRRCDKIVDCLNGEDETRCDYTKVSFTDSLLMETKNSLEDLPERKEAETEAPLMSTSSNQENIMSTRMPMDKETTKPQIDNEQPLSSIENNLAMSTTWNQENIISTRMPFDNETPKPQLDNEQSLSSTENSYLNNQEWESKKVIKDEDIASEENSNDQPKTVEETPDFSQTMIGNNDRSSEGVNDNVVTGSSLEMTTISRGDTEFVTMGFDPASLESGSSIKHMTTDDYLNVEDIVTNNVFAQNTAGETETSTSGLTVKDAMDQEEEATSLMSKENVKESVNSHSDNDTGLIVKLLPESQTLSPDQEAESKLIHKELQQITANINQEKKGSKSLPVTDNLDNLQDIVTSELEPPKSRRKHRNPPTFECRRIEQTIPYQQRCDRKADCEDGTDELDCTCTDYLITFDDKLICDGISDCADGQDEQDCFSCPEDHFLCKKSQVCLPEIHVCDGKRECPLGEDEMNCYALSNGQEMEFDLDERPLVNLEGYLTKKHFNNEWHVLCYDQLSNEEQEQAATHICRYLGFSGANRYPVKYININENDVMGIETHNNRHRRDTKERVPVQFAYRMEGSDNDTSRHTIIKGPQVLKEECVPNVTKTCKALYVACDNTLFTNFDDEDDSENSVFKRDSSVSNREWPWIAKVFVEGDYRCTGVLVNLSWVLVSDSCLWDSTLTHHFITVVLGSHRTLEGLTSMHEQVYQVDYKKDIYRNKAMLLHLKEPAHYSNVVKPMIVTSPYTPEEKSTCVAVGQDYKNNTISVFLEETNENCHPSNRCFKRKSTENICPVEVKSTQHWAGIISCHTDQGWYPAATFVDGRGECGLQDHINATDINHLKHEIHRHYGKKTLPSLIEKEFGDDCEGMRCGRGRCVGLLEVCNGVRDCEDGNDESEQACEKKHTMCDNDPYHRGCECSVGQMKCHNGKCISKELFQDGNDDCGDGTDEPGRSVCSVYLARVMPSKLCDGILNCHDRSDEDPMFCKCFAKKSYKCGSKLGVDHCVAPDMVCDGVRDCPNGEDEQVCMGLNAPQGTPYGTGQVTVRRHGVWHSKCYSSPNHTKNELEAICSELGFKSGHAKQIKEIENFVVHPYNNLVVDPFNEITLNNNTVIKMRNSHEPIAKAVFDENLKECYPVFIECR